MPTISLPEYEYTEVIAAGVDGEIYNSKFSTVFIVTASAQPAVSERGIPVIGGETKSYNMGGSSSAVWAKPSVAPYQVVINLAPAA